MNCEKTYEAIRGWLGNMSRESGTNGFVVGVSGGVDSALVSTIAASTRIETRLLTMPINQELSQIERAVDHCAWLSGKYNNVSWYKNDLTHVYDAFRNSVGQSIGETTINEVVFANLKSRIRMCALYAMANHHKCLVVGTGNKIEDYGVGFFTKYGDGGVDISPIGNLNKTQVWNLARHLGISDSIVNAKPTDGLWEDGRGDEDEFGCSYADLENSMEFVDNLDSNMFVEMYKRCLQNKNIDRNPIFEYISRHVANGHKMKMPPIGPEVVE